MGNPVLVIALRLQGRKRGRGHHAFISIISGTMRTVTRKRLTKDGSDGLFGRMKALIWNNIVINSAEYVLVLLKSGADHGLHRGGGQGRDKNQTAWRINRQKKGRITGPHAVTLRD
ncbi:MAG TPA: hypothetical protein DEF05_01065 [Erwinia sp.]|nr:hypothetical protein [Erwinia sp.]